MSTYDEYLVNVWDHDEGCGTGMFFFSEREARKAFRRVAKDLGQTPPRPAVVGSEIRFGQNESIGFYGIKYPEKPEAQPLVRCISFAEEES